MTAAARPQAGTAGASRPPSRGVDAALASLDAAIEAARTLGLDPQPAIAVRSEANERLGLSADAYVLALVGGTGVGKSSLLNALAHTTVSAAGVVRPTTAEPVAWVASSVAPRISDLLERLSVTELCLHDAPDVEDVVILDLPDVDSLEHRHRATVEALLPRVDAVAWVTDTEKYADGVLHDAFLRAWIPDSTARSSCSTSRTAWVRARSPRSGPTSAGCWPRSWPTREPAGRRWWSLPPAAASPAWTRCGRGSKARRMRRRSSPVVSPPPRRRPWTTSRARPARAARPDAGRWSTPPRAAGRAPRRPPRCCASSTSTALSGRRSRASGPQARRRGGGPVGRVSKPHPPGNRPGRAARRPGAHLRRWRSRGSLARAASIVRDTVFETVPAAPAGLRRALAHAVEPGPVEARLARAVDGVVAGLPPMRRPTSRLWRGLGLLQTAAFGILLLAAAWLLAWLLARPPVASVELPVLGPVPMPLVLVVLALLAGYGLGAVVSVHAGRVGRRWARQLRGEIRAGVDATIADEAFAGVDRIEAARRALWVASRESDATRRRNGHR